MLQFLNDGCQLLLQHTDTRVQDLIWRHHACALEVDVELLLRLVSSVTCHVVLDIVTGSAS